MTVSTFLFQTVTPAVLPACDAAGYEYYDVLGLPLHSDLAEIRKAYRAKSLRLHPDKIQQKQRDNAEAAAAEYERVQEAYAVLSDDHKRAQYHAWKCSVARYQFIENNHGLSNPVAMHENLMTASCTDKSRLLVLSTVIIVIVLLQPILIAAKVNGITNTTNGLSNTSWVLILIPLWIFFGLYVGALVIATTIVLWKNCQKNQQTKDPENTVAAMILATGESIAVLVGIVMLARQWDRATELNWHVVSIPFYIAVLIRIASYLLQLRQVRTAQNSMVSSEYLQQTYGQEDLNDEILSKHIVVTTEPSAVVAVLQVLQSSGGEVSDEDVEAVRVQTSPEFRATEQAARQLQLAIGRSILLYITMVALVAAKLQKQIDASWWIVFVPVWVCLGLPFLKHLVVCLCVGPPLNDDDDEEEVIEINIGNTSDEKKANRDMFAAAEGAMDEFNNNDEDIMAEPELLARKGMDDDLEVVKKTSEDALEADERASEKEAETAIANEDVESGGEQFSKEKTERDSQNKTDNEKDVAEDEEKKEDDKIETGSQDKSSDNDDDGPHIDEETFRRWQERVHADESEFMEQKFKAFTGCCGYCFQIIILCLIVGLIEQDYGDGGMEGGTRDDDGGGYSAFWVLFPVFLVSGILLLCCSICIYGTKEKSEGGIKEDKPDANKAEEAEPPVIIPATPAKTTEPSIQSTAGVETTTGTPEVAAAPTDEHMADIEAGIDLDDLD